MRTVVADRHLHDARARWCANSLSFGAAVGVEGQEVDHAAVKVMEEVGAAVERREGVTQVEIAADG